VFLLEIANASQSVPTMANQSRFDYSIKHYLPPEKDPEYKNMIKPSLLKPFEQLSAEALELSFPEPKVGDIVTYTGKWEDETLLGRIRDLQFRDDKGKWFADVVPLKEGKSEAVFLIDRDGTSSFEDVTLLKPVRSFYVRAENGYRVAFRGNSSTEVIFKAPKYRPIGQDFELPKVAINQEVRQEAMMEYEELKSRLLKNTFIFGAGGVVATAALFGPDVSVPYLAGVVAGAAYLFLLGKKTDNVGKNLVQGADEVKENKLANSVIGGRYLAPVGLMVLLVVARPLLMVQQDPSFVTAPFRVITKNEYLGAVAGFLTYMIALIVTEVGGEIRTEDALSVLPGSIAESFRQAKNLKGNNGQDLEDDAPPPLIPIVLVTGPRAAGRTEIVKELLAQQATALGDGYEKKGAASTAPAIPMLERMKFLTTSSEAAAKAPTKYTLISEVELEQLRREDALIYEGEAVGLFEELVPVFLTGDDILSQYGIKKEVGAPFTSIQVIEGDPTLLNALSKIPELRLINVWISLQTKEQFIEKASEIVKSELASGSGVGSTGDKQDLAKRSAEEVGALVNDAARDITFYMQKAPLFEYTLLNSLSNSATAEELLDLLRNIL